jgi:hypothetical protein
MKTLSRCFVGSLALILSLTFGLDAQAERAPQARAPLYQVKSQQRFGTALRLVRKTFTNQYGNDGRLLGQVKRFDKHASGVAGLNIKALTQGVAVKQQQVHALNTIVTEASRKGLARTAKGTFGKYQNLAAAAVNKLADVGDKSSYKALTKAMFLGGDDVIPEVAKAIKTIGARAGIPDRKVVDASKFAQDKRALVEAILDKGAVASIKPLSSDNAHAFDTYVVTFKNKVDGQQVKAVFRPTGPAKNANWLHAFSPLKRPSFSFVSREVFSYQFDKRIKAGRVPPTTAAILNVPGYGASIGSLQYFVPKGKSLGANWKDTRPELRKFESSKPGTRQMDVVRMMAYIAASDEHVANSRMGGNKGNIFVTKQNPFPVSIGSGKKERVMMIDNANSWVHKSDLSDNMLPQRFEKRLVGALRGETRQGWMKFAAPLLGERQAGDAWNRIQHTLNVAKTRPTW